MEDNSDTDLISSLKYVVDNIYSSCDIEKNDAVPVSTLVDFMSPHLPNHPSGLAGLRVALDPKNENPIISRNTFYEAMQKWTSNINEHGSRLSNFSFKESDSDEKNLPFHQSTPKPSLAPSSRQNSSDVLNFSNLSPPSFSTISGSTVACDKIFLEEKFKELEHKYINAMSELSMVRSQLAVTEEQYSEVKMDLDRTNKRLILEQQVNADLQKSMDHKDDFKEEVVSARKELEHLQKMWSLTKKENSNLVATLRALEFEKDQSERKINEVRKKEEHKKKEFADLQATLAMIEEENNALKKIKDGLEERVDQQNSLLKHYTEITAMMKNDICSLQTMISKSGLSHRFSPSAFKNPSYLSTLGTPNISSKKFEQMVKSITPFKNMYHPTSFNREFFNSPKLLCQIVSPISPNGLDTPKNVKKSEREDDIYFSALSDKFESPMTAVMDSSKGVQLENFFQQECTEKLPSVIHSSDSAEKSQQNDSLLSDTPSPSASSANVVCESFDDLDLSTFSEKQNAQDLMSELQECKFLDNSNKCYVEEHAEWLKIVKEHENCSKIICEYEQKIQLLSEDIEIITSDHNDLLGRYQDMEKDAKSLEDLVKNTKSENVALVQENCKLSKEITSIHNTLNEKDKELFEMYNFKTKNQQLSQQIEDLRKEYNTVLNKYECIINEKEIISKQLGQTKSEKNVLINDNNKLLEMNNILNNKIEQNEKKLLEMEGLINENKLLEDEILNMRNEQDKNCHEVDKLTRRLEQCNEMSKSFVAKIKKKIIDQNTKMEHLKEFNEKLEEFVEELKTEIQITKTNLNILKSSNEKSINRERTDEDASTSPEGSDSNLTIGRSGHRKRSSYNRRLSYDKQQCKIEKLVDEIEILQKDICNEKVRNQNIAVQVSNLELQNINLEEEKNSILRELETTKYNLSLKDSMMLQFEEKHKFEMENLRESHEKEKDLVNLALRDANKKAKDAETVLHVEIEKLEKALDDCKHEKKCLEKLLEKQETKIISLKKALSDLTLTTEEGKVLETLVVEKESMLKFNRELLAKSNNSLQMAENRVISLELLLDKCKMVLLETAEEVFRSAKSAFGVWKDTLKSIGANQKLTDELESLESIADKTVTELTEQEIWTIHNQLSLASQLLNALATKTGADFLGNKELSSNKSVSKFTLRPSKLQFRRLPSSDPDVSSTCIKECEAPENENKENRTNVQETMTDETGQELLANEVVGPKIHLKENDSISDWLGQQIESLSVQINETSNGASCSNNLTETETAKTFQSVGVGDSYLAESIKEEEFVLEKPSQLSGFRKCSSFAMMMISVICLLVMLSLYLHLECIRHGNGSIICPLDFLVSIKKTASGTTPY